MGKPVPKRDGVSSTHSRRHLLLRISQSDDVKTSELKPSHLDTDLANMEARLNDSLSKLERKIDAKLEQDNDTKNGELQKELHKLNLQNTELQERLEKLEAKVDGQLGVITSLLQELLVTAKSPKFERE